MINRALTVVAVWLAGAGVASASDHELALYAVGKAVNADTGEYLYSEFHYCSRDITTCSIDYRDSMNTSIAVKDVDYGASPYAPNLFLREFGIDAVVAYESSGSDEVVDAGFDNFVRSRWDTLAAGEKVTFPFRALGFDRAFDMRAGKARDGDCDDNLLCLRVQVDSWLLGLVAQPIDLAYNRDDRRLLRYRGVSNLRSRGLNSQQVEISYTYQDHLAYLP